MNSIQNRYRHQRAGAARDLVADSCVFSYWISRFAAICPFINPQLSDFVDDLLQFVISRSPVQSRPPATPANLVIADGTPERKFIRDLCHGIVAVLPMARNKSERVYRVDKFIVPD